MSVDFMALVFTSWGLRNPQNYRMPEQHIGGLLARQSDDIGVISAGMWGKVKKAKNHAEKSNGRKKKNLKVWKRNPNSVGLSSSGKEGRLFPESSQALGLS